MVFLPHFRSLQYCYIHPRPRPEHERDVDSGLKEELVDGNALPAAGRSSGIASPRGIQSSQQVAGLLCQNPTVKHVRRRGRSANSISNGPSREAAIVLPWVVSRYVFR